MEEPTCTKTRIHTRRISLEASPSDSTNKIKSDIRQRYKLLSMCHLTPNSLLNPKSETILCPKPSRPHLADQPEEIAEENDYSSLVDTSRALKKFTTKRVSVNLLKRGGTKTRAGKKYPPGFKGCLYKLHCANKPKPFIPPPPFKSIQVGEVKRTYGKAARKNITPIQKEHVEVKIECDPALLLHPIDMEDTEEVNQEDEIANECKSFEFINVKEETEIIDCDEYISD